MGRSGLYPAEKQLIARALDAERGIAELYKGKSGSPRQGAEYRQNHGGCSVFDKRRSHGGIAPSFLYTKYTTRRLSWQEHKKAAAKCDSPRYHLHSF